VRGPGGSARRRRARRPNRGRAGPGVRAPPLIGTASSQDSEKIAALLGRCRRQEQAALDPLTGGTRRFERPRSKVARSVGSFYPSSEQVCVKFVARRVWRNVVRRRGEQRGPTAQ